MPESSSAAIKHRARNFYGRTPPSLPSCKTELDILIERHQFIRDSDEQNLSWEDALAKKTYDQLFKEIAVCDLSRWREGKVAMRWRTASEVINGIGHFTCSNLRCKFHEPSKLNHPQLGGMKSMNHTGFEEQESFISLDSSSNQDHINLSKADYLKKNSKFTLQELQTCFSYIEHNERKVAQVKLKLCKKCVKRMNSCSALSKRHSRQAVDASQSNTVPQSSSKRDRLVSSHEDNSHSTEHHDSRPLKSRRTHVR